MVEAQFKAKRILKLYFNVWVLTAGISILLLLLGWCMVSIDIYCTDFVISVAKKVFLFEQCKSKAFFDYCVFVG